MKIDNDNDNSSSGESSAVAATISTTKTTKIRGMKKEKKEEEEEEIAENRLGSDDETADPKVKYGERIKKEEEVEEATNEDKNKNDLDPDDPLSAAVELGEKYRTVNIVYSYAGWKTGNWCWLSSPVKKDNSTGSNISNTMTLCDNQHQQQQHQQLSQPQLIRNNSTTTCCVKSEDISVDNNSINDGNNDSKRKAMLDGVFHNDDEGINNSNDKSSPKKKLKFCRHNVNDWNNNGNNDNSEQKPNNISTTTGIIKKEKTERDISNNNKGPKSNTNDTNDRNNDKYIETVNGIKMEEENNEYKANDILSANTNSNNNNNNNISDTINHNNDNDNGYESWTEGNWCWLSKPSSTRGFTSSSSRGGVEFPSTKQQTKNEDIENETDADRKYDEHDYDDDDDDGDNGIVKDGDNVGNEDGIDDGYDNDEDEDEDEDVTDDGYESWIEGNWCWLLPNNNGSTKTTTKSKIVRLPSNIRVPLIVSATTHTIRVRRHTRAPTTKTHQKDMRYTQDHNERWNKMFRRLVGYKEKNKTAHNPQKFKEDPALGKWVEKQRERYKKELISKDRVDLLNSIQFVWDQNGMQWNNMYQRLLTYKSKHTSTSISRCHQEDPQLGVWVHTQRSKKKQLSIERLNLLKSTGFAWKIQDRVPWIETYQKLVAYKQCYQNTLVPQRYTEDPHLGHWVSRQRKSNNMGNLSKRKMELLNSIDFVWSVKK